jgi:hypothetical protein
MIMMVDTVVGAGSNVPVDIPNHSSKHSYTLNKVVLDPASSILHIFFPSLLLSVDVVVVSMEKRSLQLR